MATIDIRKPPNCQAYKRAFVALRSRAHIRPLKRCSVSGFSNSKKKEEADPFLSSLENQPSHPELPLEDRSWLQSKHDAAILDLAGPAILALAADPLLSLVDTAFVGSAGAEPLAALGVCSALFTFFFLVFNFLATATTPLVAGALASGEKERAGVVVLQGIVLALGIGSGLCYTLITTADTTLDIMGAGPSSSQVHVLAKEFLVVRAIAAPGTLLMTAGQGVFRGLRDMRTPLFITVGANAVNFVLDAVLILGFGWGVTGAAIATSTAEIGAALAYLAALWRRKDDFGGIPSIDGLQLALSRAASDVSPFFRAGSAILMRTVLLLGVKTAASATAARLGSVPMAAHQIVMQVWVLSSFMVDSLAVAGQALIAIDLGQGEATKAREVADRLMQLGIGSGVILAITAFILQPELLPNLFTDDKAVEDEALSILPLACAMLPINAAVYVLDGVLVGASDFRFLAVGMLAAAGTAVPLLLLVEPLKLGLTGVWGSLAVLMASRLALLTWRYNSSKGPLRPPKN